MQDPSLVVPLAQGPPTARQMYLAAKAVRESLGNSLGRLQDKRRDIANELANEETKGLDRSGLEARLKDIDARILDMDKQIAVADANQAQAAGFPGAAVEPPQPRRPGPPEEFYGVLAFGIFVFGFPISLAYARRIWRRSAKTTVTLPPDVAARMQAMEEAIEAVAVEVERVGEGQRFMTQALSDGSRSAPPLPVRKREVVHAEHPT
jgi:hypothetical protein